MSDGKPGPRQGLRKAMYSAESCGWRRGCSKKRNVFLPNYVQFSSVQFSFG